MGVRPDLFDGREEALVEIMIERVGPALLVPDQIPTWGAVVDRVAWQAARGAASAEGRRRALKGLPDVHYETLTRDFYESPGSAGS